MWYKIEEVALIGDMIRLVVNMWGSAEDRFLGLAPFLSNDFLFPSETKDDVIIREIGRYARRAFSRGTRGDCVSHKIDGKVIVGHSLLGSEGKI